MDNTSWNFFITSHRPQCSFSYQWNLSLYSGTQYRLPLFYGALKIGMVCLYLFSVFFLKSLWFQGTLPIKGELQGQARELRWLSLYFKEKPPWCQSWSHPMDCPPQGGRTCPWPWGLDRLDLEVGQSRLWGFAQLVILAPCTGVIGRGLLIFIYFF